MSIRELGTGGHEKFWSLSKEIGTFYISSQKINKSLIQTSDFLHSSFQRKEILLCIKLNLSGSLYWGKKKSHMDLIGQMISFPESDDIHMQSPQRNRDGSAEGILPSEGTPPVQ